MTQYPLEGMPPVPEREEWCYFSFAGGTIKIGYALEPFRRNRKLQRRVLLLRHGGQAEEERQHKLWSKERIGDTENFRVSKDLLIWVCGQVVAQSLSHECEDLYRSQSIDQLATLRDFLRELWRSRAD